MNASNVKLMKPLESIPHMLRLWADMFESGEESMPKSVTLVCIASGGDVPTVYGAGVDASNLEQAGAMLFCANRVVSVEVDGS